MYENWKFERWESRISNERLLSVLSLVDDGEELSIIVTGLSGKHISFVFTDYPAYRNIQELYRTELWNKLRRKNFGSTLIIPESEWITSFKREVMEVYHTAPVHFMICTGDSCIEVISSEVPKISEVEILSAVNP
ncbi:MAG TPA: hypothetical protein VM866_01280 [Pyrinomonadaceae bacterium]|nr:hypothetical protein [Pyrinomonadaceae bacterium]